MTPLYPCEDGNEGTAVCPVCGERDVWEAFVPVYYADSQWHRKVVDMHQECRELWVAANLEAVLESLRLVSL